VVRPNPRWGPAIILENSNGDISTTGHSIHFMFDSKVGFWDLADQMDPLPVEPNPRGSLTSYWKISNKCTFGMGYPSHFHETDRIFAGITERIMDKE